MAAVGEGADDRRARHPGRPPPRAARHRRRRRPSDAGRCRPRRAPRGAWASRAPPPRAPRRRPRSRCRPAAGSARGAPARARPARRPPRPGTRRRCSPMPGVGHDLGLAERADGDPRRAGLELQAGQAHALVRLDVRAERATPRSAIADAMAAMLRSTTSRSITTAGVWSPPGRANGGDVSSQPAVSQLVRHTRHSASGSVERVAVDAEEVGRSALPDDARLRLAEQLPSAPGGRRQRVGRLQARGDEARDLPRELVGAQRAATEVAAGGDGHARVDAPCGSTPRPAPAGPGRPGAPPRRSVGSWSSREAQPGAHHRERAHQGDAAPRHLGRDRGVEVESVLDRVDPSQHRLSRAVQPARMCGHAGTAPVDDLGHARDLVRRPRRDVDVRPVHVELDEVGAGIELADGRAEELVRVGGLDRPVHRAQRRSRTASSRPRAGRDGRRVPPIGHGRRGPAPARVRRPGRSRSASPRHASSEHRLRCQSDRCARRRRAAPPAGR